MRTRTPSSTLKRVLPEVLALVGIKKLKLGLKRSNTNSTVTASLATASCPWYLTLLSTAQPSWRRSTKKSGKKSRWNFWTTSATWSWWISRILCWKWLHTIRYTLIIWSEKTWNRNSQFSNFIWRENLLTFDNVHFTRNITLRKNVFKNTWFVFVRNVSRAKACKSTWTKSSHWRIGL